MMLTGFGVCSQHGFNVHSPEVQLDTPMDADDFAISLLHQVRDPMYCVI